MLPTQEASSLDQLLDSLGITADILATLRLPRYDVAAEVVIAETDTRARVHYLVPEAARAWSGMKAAAARDGIVVELVSAFRTLEDQADIIREKLARHMPMSTILTLSAPPGYSEHHTGRAIDINTPGCEEREEPFERTLAFGWLQAHAASYGFALSYPRGNELGFIYEPWHWCYQQPVSTEQADTGSKA